MSETGPKFENVFTPEHHRELESERLMAPDLEKSRHKPAENIDAIRHRAQSEALQTQEVQIDKTDENPAARQAYVNRELKNMAYARLLNRARKQMGPLQKSFSKFTHQPAVDSVSEAVASTLGRPSGLLGAGLLGSAGTAAYYYIAKHYGYDYNYFIFIALLGVGLVAGWTVEILLKTLRKHKA